MLPWLLAGLIFADPGLEKVQVTQGTSGARSASLELHAGGLKLHQDEVGVLFGTLRVGRSKPQFTYLILFKHLCTAQTPIEWSEEVTASGDVASSKQLLSIDGNSLIVEYQLNLEKSTGPRRTLTLNKKQLDLSKGRVLLVDLTLNPPNWNQRKCELPADVGETMSKKSTEQLLQKCLESLEKKDAKIREFIRATKR